MPSTILKQSAAHRAEQAAAASLEALKTKPNIRWARITSPDGSVFASYKQSDPNRTASGQHAPGTQVQFQRDRLLLSVPLVSEGSSIGMSKVTSVEKLEADFSFQILNLSGERRLRHAQPARRAPVMLLLADRYEIPQVSQFHFDTL